jgi:hypothetical protein
MGFLILGSIRPAGNRCHRPRNRREARGQSGAGGYGRSRCHERPTAKSYRHSPSAYPRHDGMATIRKNALPGPSGFWRKQALPEPSERSHKQSIKVRSNGPLQGWPRDGRCGPRAAGATVGEGLSPGRALPHPALNQFLGQVFETPRSDRWRAVSCTGSQELAYHALARTAQIQIIATRIG